MWYADRSKYVYVGLEVFTEVKNTALCFFYPEDEGNKFLRNGGI
jgi:hypothetical protein